MFDHARRFGGLSRLYGAEGAARLCEAHVCVIGIGGVGSWAAEALARCGVGKLTLVDLDMVAESNTNRQIHALDGVYGKAKVEAMAERVKAINNDCQVQCIEEFVDVDNVSRILGGKFSAVVDAIDQVRAKAAVIAYCKERRIPVFVAGAAGGQIDPARIGLADLSRTTQDPLLAKVRSYLRREYGFPRGEKGKFGVTAVFSTEPLRYPESNGSCDAQAANGLNCAGFGSLVCITGIFGLFLASQVVNLLATEKSLSTKGERSAL